LAVLLVAFPLKREFFNHNNSGKENREDLRHGEEAFTGRFFHGLRIYMFSWMRL